MRLDVDTAPRIGEVPAALAEALSADPAAAAAWAAPSDSKQGAPAEPIAAAKTDETETAASPRPCPPCGLPHSPGSGEPAA